MTKVYIVYHTDNLEDRFEEVAGVFSSADKAVKFIEDNGYDKEFRSKIDPDEEDYSYLTIIKMDRYHRWKNKWHKKDSFGDILSMFIKEVELDKPQYIV